MSPVWSNSDSLWNRRRVWANGDRFSGRHQFETTNRRFRRATECWMPNEYIQLDHLKVALLYRGTHWYTDTPTHTEDIQSEPINSCQLTTPIEASLSQLVFTWQSNLKGGSEVYENHPDACHSVPNRILRWDISEHPSIDFANIKSERLPRAQESEIILSTRIEDLGICYTNWILKHLRHSARFVNDSSLRSRIRIITIIIVIIMK